jgi:hypothetical protein
VKPIRLPCLNPTRPTLESRRANRANEAPPEIERIGLVRASRVNKQQTLRGKQRQDSASEWPPRVGHPSCWSRGPNHCEARPRLGAIARFGREHSGGTLLATVRPEATSERSGGSSTLTTSQADR